MQGRNQKHRKVFLCEGSLHLLQRVEGLNPIDFVDCYNLRLFTEFRVEGLQLLREYFIVLDQAMIVEPSDIQHVDEKPSSFDVLEKLDS